MAFFRRNRGGLIEAMSWRRQQEREQGFSAAIAAASLKRHVDVNELAAVVSFSAAIAAASLKHGREFRRRGLPGRFSAAIAAASLKLVKQFCDAIPIGVFPPQSRRPH